MRSPTLTRASLTLTVSLGIMLAGAAAARVVDGPDPPQDPVLRREFARILSTSEDDALEKWRTLSAALRQRLLEHPVEMWRPVVMCNFIGHPLGSPAGRACEAETLANTRNAAAQWDENGQFKGPSPECVARDKRDKWGVLRCE